MQLYSIGVDVSKHNGVVDFSAIKAAGYSFVILRAGFGKSVSQRDARFEENYAKAKAVGLDVGVYWFSYANSEAEAGLEADCCLKVIDGKKLEYPVYYDLENEERSNYWPFKQSKAHCSGLVRAFCSRIESAGYWAGLYISRSPLQTHITPEVAERYALWIAEYSSTCKYTGSYGMWQYTPRGRIAGNSCDFDLNECYINYPELIKKAGLNGYKKEEPQNSPTVAPRYNVVVGVYDTKAEAEEALREARRAFPGAVIKKTIGMK